jgi:hypothetical protein
VQIWDDLSKASAVVPPTRQPAGGVPLASTVITGPPSTSTYGWLVCDLADTAGRKKALQVNPNQRYYVTWTPLWYNGATGAPLIAETSLYNVMPGEFVFDSLASDPTVTRTRSDRSLTMYVVQSYGGTTVNYLNWDPSDILKQIINDYNRQGGTLTYDSTSIDKTGTLVSYKFNTNTTLEGIQQCLTLAPAGWYFYIDLGTNKVHFHSKTTATKRILQLGRDLEQIDFLKRTESIINTVYFTGGPNPANTAKNVYRVYRNLASVTTYGKMAFKYTDNRVTDQGTMNTIANALLNEYPAPEVRTTVTLLDDFFTTEDIKPGDIFTFRGFPWKRPNLLDVGLIDDFYLDFDLANPESYEMQVARFDYTPDKIVTTLSSTPPDVHKRVEDIKRNLDAQEVANNPFVASEQT